MTSKAIKPQLLTDFSMISSRLSPSLLRKLEKFVRNNQPQDEDKVQEGKTHPSIYASTHDKELVAFLENSYIYNIWQTVALEVEMFVISFYKAGTYHVIVNTSQALSEIGDTSKTTISYGQKIQTAIIEATRNLLWSVDDAKKKAIENSRVKGLEMRLKAEQLNTY